MLRAEQQETKSPGDGIATAFGGGETNAGWKKLFFWFLSAE